MRLLALGTILLLASAAAAEDRAYLGVSVGALDEEHRAHFDIPADVQEGVVLQEVREGSAAAAAGFKPGDVITAFDGKPVKTMEELIAAVTAKKAGDTVSYVLRRGSGTIEGTLRLGKREEIAPPPPPAPEDLDGRLDRVQEEIEQMHRRIREARERRMTRRPAGLEAWIDREERHLVEARERGDLKRVVFHEARLSLLREMRDEGFRAPPAGRPGLEDRVERLEQAVKRILERLERE